MADNPMMPNLDELMQQAQQMQSKMQHAQEQLVKLTVTGESGGGVVKLVMNGRHEVSNVDIDEDMMDEKEVLQELVAAAINDAVQKIEKAAQDKMKSLAKEMGLPEGFDGGTGGLGGFGG